MNTVSRKIKLEDGQKIFFFSDPHFGHRNICRGTTSWDLNDHGGTLSVRDFDTLEEMNDKIVNDINDTVKEDDWLVCLGDWAFGGRDNTWNFRDRINCKNIILVLGNHDEQIESNRQLNNCYRDLGVGIFTGTPDLGAAVYAQHIFESVYGRLQLNVKDSKGSRTYECNHFPWVVWDKAHHGRVHLYGHVHGSYTHPGRAMDVGIDNINRLYGDFCPLSEDQIADYMEGREFIQQSHHNSKTN